MQFLQKIKLIQGGMGVYVSNWRLARAVAMEQPGTTPGTVSGTALDIVYVRLLQLGDPGGHVRRALAAFDAQFGVLIAKRSLIAISSRAQSAGSPLQKCPKQWHGCRTAAISCLLGSRRPRRWPSAWKWIPSNC